MRIGNVWDQAKAIADDRGDKLNFVVEAALRRYIQKHRPKTATQEAPPTEVDGAS